MSQITKIGVSRTFSHENCLPKIFWLFVLVLFILSTAAFSWAQQTANFEWLHQYGPSILDWAYDIAVDDSGVYVVGVTRDSYDPPVQEVNIRKYDPNGNLIWSLNMGTPDWEYIFSICVHSSYVYIAGSTRGAFPGQTKGGSHGAYVAKLISAPPAEGVQLLISKVLSLTNEGKLLPYKSGGFIGKLEEALKALDKARPNIRVACNKLSDFIDQVNSCIQSGAFLDPADGQALIDAANAIISELCG